MEKHCLFIDDNPDDVENVLVNLKEIGHGKGLILDCDLIRINDFFEEEFLDILKIDETISHHMNVKAYDIVACDFDFEDNKINGLDVVKIVRQRNKICDVILYSGSLDTIATYISKIEGQKERYKKIKTIVDCKIRSFFDRTDIESNLIGILKEKIRLETIIENRLKEHGDLLFKHGYKNFEGKKLKDVAYEIEKDSHHGIKFKKEIIERAIDHMIELNNIN